jgi:hypothetical protein
MTTRPPEISQKFRPDFRIRPQVIQRPLKNSFPGELVQLLYFRSKEALELKPASSFVTGAGIGIMKCLSVLRGIDFRMSRPSSWSVS